MKLVQKVLSHGLLIALVVAAFFIYTKRAELFPQWFARSGTAVSLAAGESRPRVPEQSVSRPKPEKVISKQPVVPADEQPAAVADDVAVPTAVPAGNEAGASGQPASVDDTPPPAAADAAGGSGTEALRASPGDAAVQQTGVMPQQQPSAPEQALPDGAADADQAVAYRPVSPAPAGATAPPQTTTTPGQALQQQLEQARVLYWRKDMSAAATAYQSLSQTYPDNADIWGEAGNFYLNMQQREQAADAYSHAVDLLMQQGQQQRARQLLDVMYRLDEDKARALETRLQQSGG